MEENKIEGGNKIAMKFIGYLLIIIFASLMVFLIYLGLHDWFRIFPI